jgi:pre-rRNA-processing protein TSR3
MDNFPPTIILRHRKENLKKCSLRGLETRKDCQFFTYPQDSIPPLENYVLLSFEGPQLSEKDRDQGIFLIDGTWKYATVMQKKVPSLSCRSLPKQLRTAYPRKQTDCLFPEEGLASVEALYAAYFFTGRSTEGLLDHYYWKELFLEKNVQILQ